MPQNYEISTKRTIFSTLFLIYLYMNIALKAKITNFAPMIVTRDFLYAVFDKYNKLCFGDTLKRPIIVVSNAKRQLGLFMPRKPIPVIKVSNFYDRPEIEYINTLVHEMIHYYIYDKGLKDSSSHGVIFKRLMNEINQQVGLSMSVRTKTDEWQAAKIVNKMRNVLFVEMRNGKHFITVVSPSAAKQVEQTLFKLSLQVKSRRWFTTNDPYFSNFPTVRTLRGRPVTAEEYHDKLNKMIALCNKEK